MKHFVKFFCRVSLFCWPCISNKPANIYLFKVNNRNTRKKCEICSKLTIKTPERRHRRRSGVFIVNFEIKFFTGSTVSSPLYLKKKGIMTFQYFCWKGNSCKEIMMDRIGNSIRKMRGQEIQQFSKFSIFSLYY